MQSIECEIERSGVVSKAEVDCWRAGCIQKGGGGVAALSHGRAVVVEGVMVV